MTGTTISITVDDREVLAALGRLVARSRDLRPAFADIGAALVLSTRRRFDATTGPDGVKWAANSPVTLARFAAGPDGRRITNQDGRLRKAAALRLAYKKPLHGHTLLLRDRIAWRADSSGVTIGTNVVYAAAQQFGMKRGYAGSNRRGRPIPWGDIPARPFLGLSEADRREVLDILGAHLLPGA